MGILGVLPLGAAVGVSGKFAPYHCDSSFDSYRYTRSALAACGYATYPQKSVTALPGGGLSHNYIVHSAAVHVFIPPAGFEPATATTAQLNEYGFPPRPADAAGLRQWQKEFSNWTGAVSPPPFLTEINASSETDYSDNWSGYVIKGTLHTFSQAETTFIEPDKSYPSACSSHAEVTWAGLGGWYSGSTLAQDGTYLGNEVGGIDNHQAWWEIYPQNAIEPVPFHASPGYPFDASTRWLGNGYYRFFMYDYHTGHSWAMDALTEAGYSNDSAEAIAERPTDNGKLTHLTNFGTLRFSWAKANDKGFNKYSPAGVRAAIRMQDINGNDMATPSEIGNIGYFTDTQHSCE